MTSRYHREEREFTDAEMRVIARKIAAKFPDRVSEVENADMDPGRFFVHLRAPWGYNEGNGPGQRTRSFGGLLEAYGVLRNVQREEE